MRLIDADAFIQMMEEKHDPSADLDHIILSVCKGAVAIMPTVDTISMHHGKWIHHDSNDSHVPPYDECNQCGWKVRIGLNYCPKCGSRNRIRGENTNND